MEEGREEEEREGRKGGKGPGETSADEESGNPLVDG